MEIKKLPPTLDEVIKKKEIVTTGSVTIPEGHKGYPLGTVFTTKDGGVNWNVKPANFDGSANTDEVVFYEGKTYKSTVDNNVALPSSLADWDDLGVFDANGVLAENAKTTGRYAFVTMGEVREKHLEEYDVSMKHSLFKNKIRLK